ncbi:MAG TPA: hypothetical protein PLJ83_13060 [Spirochaetales bacterium]|nr:hypothetical protein [Spirochaetales bacterium]
MSYNAKNYTEQGGEKTVIGGKLEIKEGASVTGLPSAINQAASTATTVAGVKDDFNALLLKLKDSGLMTPDAWNVSVAKIPTPTGDDLTANQSKVTAITIGYGVITVAAPVSELIAFPSSNPAQGTHKWIGMLITTGLPDITAVKYNGSQLTSADAAEAAAVGGSAGDIVMWLKCDEIVSAPKVFTLWASGYPEATFTVAIAEPE